MRLKQLSRWTSVLLTLALVLGGLSQGRHLTGVLVTALPGAKKVQDALGGKPDWRLDLRAGSSWEKLSTFDDQEFGDSLRWELSSPLLIGKIDLVRLVEDDLAGDDVIEEVRLQGETFDGPEYRYELTLERRPLAGILWFAAHWPGIALTALLAVSLILSFFRIGSVALFAAETATGV